MDSAGLFSTHIRHHAAIDFKSAVLKPSKDLRLDLRNTYATLKIWPHTGQERFEQGDSADIVSLISGGGRDDTY